MKINQLCIIINGIIFGVIFVLILIESIFNILGLWTAWNLFGYFVCLFLLPILIIVALISTGASVISFFSYKNTNDNISLKTCLLSILFFVLDVFLTILADTFIFTWGFGI